MRCRSDLFVLAFCLTLAACAGDGRIEAAPGGPGSTSLTPQTAQERLAIGRSRKSEVAAALGPAIVIAFDSGYEVWVYRWPGAERTSRAATELVLLFDPSGLLTKLRLRPGYPEPAGANSPAGK